MKLPDIKIVFSSLENDTYSVSVLKYQLFLTRVSITITSECLLCVPVRSPALDILSDFHHDNEKNFTVG